MRTPMIPDTLRICETCERHAAANGEAECDRCERARVRRAAMCRGVERFYGPQFAGPAGLRITELPACPRPANDDLWETLPRTVVPEPTPARRELIARRVTAWAGLLVLCLLTAGWLFGRFA